MTAPDFVEPIVGYRAWRVDGDALVPWSAARAGAAAWTAGVNQAVCLHLGAHPGRVPPVAECSCGLYALARSTDERLRPAHEAVGAIAAWGDVEVHASGFRAQYAAVVALALPERCDGAHAAGLGAAARRYGVPVVPADGLVDTALEYGRPIAFAAIPAAPRRGLVIHRAPVPPLGAEGTTGIALDEHLVATIERGGIRLEPTPPLARAIAASPMEAPGPGEALAAGDVLGRAGGFVLRTPVAGVVGEPPVGRLATWLAPTGWDEDGRAFAWGAAGRRFYAAELADATRRGDPFASLRTHWLHAHARIRSADDVLQVLREERARPRFRSGAELEARLQAARAHPEVARAVGRLPHRIVWRVHRPHADIAIGAGAREAVTLYAAAEPADDYFAGRLDLAAALRRREVQSPAETAAVLRAASVLKPLHARYAEASSSASSRAS
ncbi:MAG TPA: hypothetical protein VGW10_11115 [Solirubrobacteraceae bacterium]|nr:hypothetical protein [Solirubrobacteraceae bacterium]